MSFFLQMITHLGGNVVENPQFCTHLVAQSFSRTMKFFVAINVCQFILNRQWIEESHQKGILQREFLLIIPPQNQFFRANAGISLSVGLYVPPCICVPNTSFCQISSGGIKSHLMTALVYLSPHNLGLANQKIFTVRCRKYWRTKPKMFLTLSQTSPGHESALQIF